MANRVLRDWTTSEAVDSISFEAEVFFTRLIMKADDYGSYYANPKLLKAALFPLKDVTFQQIGAWVFECIDAGLIFSYEVDGKEYIRISNFKQRLRNMRNVFPHPIEDDDNHSQPPADNSLRIADNSLTTRRESPPERETKEKQKQETKQESEGTRAPVSFEKISRGTKLEIFEELFSDELYIEQLSMTHRGKDLKQAFEECYTHHANAPNPPLELWEWKQKLNTWLVNTKRNGTSKKTDTINSRREAFAKRHSSDAGG